MFNRLSAVFAFFLIFFPITQTAQADIFIREYTHRAGDADSKISSRAIALDQVKKLLLDEIGTHIRSRFEVSRNQDGVNFASEEIETLTAGVVSVSVMEEKWDGLSYFLKAKLEADPKQVLTALEQFKQKDAELVEQLSLEREALKIARKELEKYKNGFSSYNNEQLGKEAQNYNRSIKVLQSYDHLEEGIKLYSIGNYTKAAELLKKAEELGSEKASITLAKMYFSGKGVKQNPDRANSLFKKIKNNVISQAHEGVAFYQNTLGILYAQGLGGVEKDKDLAYTWFKKAANQAYIPAMGNLAGLYLGNQEHSKVKAVYEKLIEMDSIYGYSGLAFLYQKGFGVEQDRKKAFELNLIAANKGSSDAMSMIAAIYLHGGGVVTPAPEKAMEMFRKSAELGAPDGFAGMGDLYQMGAGVPRDLGKAKEYYLKGAEYGSTVSYFRLGSMYLQGAGVTPDLEKAKYWLQKGVDSGDASSKQLLSRIP